MLSPGMTSEACGEYLECLIEQWALANPLLHTVYLSFGYSDMACIRDRMGYVGCKFRMMKLPLGKWRSVNTQYWHPDNRSFFQDAYRPYDDLPGILEEDIDFFA